MSKNFLYSALAISLSSLLLTACGSDSSNKKAYTHVYNVSPNSTELTLEIEVDDDDDDEPDYVFSNIDFADASSGTNVKSGTFDVTLSGMDEDLEDEELFTSSLTFKNNKRNLVVMYGDFEDLQLLNFVYDIDDLDDEDDTMRLYVGDFSTDSQGYNIYWSDSSDELADAQLLASTTGNTIIEVGDFETETYNFYLTDADGNLVFTAADVSLTGETAYFLLIRDSFGPAAAGIALDKVTNSTTVVTYEDDNGDAQYRVINVTDQTLDINLSYSGTNYPTDNLAADTATSYNVVGYNDYTVKVLDQNGNRVMQNLALSLPQNVTKSLVTYQQADGTVDAVSFTENVRILKYQTNVNFVNLAYDQEQVNVFFVGPAETIDSAEYSIENVDFEEVESSVIGNQDYRINVTIDSDDDTIEILNQTDLDMDDSKNYTLILYKDDAEPLGYGLLVVEE